MFRLPFESPFSAENGKNYATFIQTSYLIDELPNEGELKRPCDYIHNIPYGVTSMVLWILKGDEI